MIFYFKTNGHLVYNSQTEICQGSNGVNIIYVIAPFNSASQVTARVILPNGKTLETEFLTLRKDLSAECFSIDEKGLSIWSFDVPYSITKFYGLLRIQFAFTSSNETITTESVSVVIKKGVSSQEDFEIEDSTTIEKIKNYIALAQQNLGNKLEKDESETSNRQAYVKRANGVQTMIDITEKDGGSIVQRKNDGNIYAGDPESYNDATPKYYVDNRIAEIKNENYNRTQVNDMFSGCYTKSDIDSKLSYIYTKDETNTKLAQEFYDRTQLNERLKTYAVKEDMENKLENCVNEDRLTERLMPFITAYDLNAKLLNYYSKTLTDKNFYKKTEVDNKLVEKQDKLTAGKNINLDNNVVSFINEWQLYDKITITQEMIDQAGEEGITSVMLGDGVTKLPNWATEICVTFAIGSTSQSGGTISIAFDNGIDLANKWRNILFYGANTQFRSGCSYVLYTKIKARQTTLTFAINDLSSKADYSYGSVLGSTFSFDLTDRFIITSNIDNNNAKFKFPVGTRVSVRYR